MGATRLTDVDYWPWPARSLHAEPEPIHGRLISLKGSMIMIMIASD